MTERAQEPWLEASGTRVRVSSGGVLIGRDPGCDIVLPSPEASRHHAVVVSSAAGCEVLALGRRDLLVNGRPTRKAALGDGDRVEVPGLALTLRLVEPESAAVGFRLAAAGVAVGVPPGGLVVGDRVAFPGWPSGVLTVRPSGDQLVVRAAEPWTRNGYPVPRDEEVALRPGDVIGRPDAADITVERSEGALATTTGPEDALPDRVELQFLVHGGRLRVWRGGDERTVWIAERRFALLMCLLSPPEPHAPGDAVSDEVVLAGVWPRQPGKGRVDVNVLLKRLRTDLVGAGLSADLVVRAEGGGATRFRIAPGASVRVV